MLHTDAYIQQITNCAKSKLAAASLRLQMLNSYGAYKLTGIIQLHVEALQVWLFILKNWVNVDQHYNRVTEQELSNVIEEVLRLPYSCTLASEPVPIPANQPPLVNAGVDQSLSAGATAATLSGTATDPEGGTLTYQWTKISGPNVTIVSPTALVTGLSNMQTGTYVFQLKATDAGGLSAVDTVQITIPQLLDTVYYGRSTNYVIGSQVLILAGANFQFNAANDTPIPWYQGATLPQHCWVAIPNRTASHLKNKWYVDILNNGDIGGVTDLFGPPDIVSVNGTDYLFWITNYQTQFTATCLFKKV